MHHSAILKKGFNPSKDGLLGKGVYVTTDRSKAQAFAGDDGRILRAAANLGHVQTVDARAARKYGFSETAWHKTHDSAYVPQGEGVARPEHCVKDPARVIPLAGFQENLEQYMEEIESKPNEILTATESKLQEHNIRLRVLADESPAASVLS
eukprot:g11041.t1